MPEFESSELRFPLVGDGTVDRALKSKCLDPDDCALESSGFDVSGRWLTRSDGTEEAVKKCRRRVGEFTCFDRDGEVPLHTGTVGCVTCLNEVTCGDEGGSWGRCHAPRAVCTTHFRPPGYMGDLSDLPSSPVSDPVPSCQTLPRPRTSPVPVSGDCVSV